MKVRTKEEAVAFRKQIEAAALNLDDKGASMSADFYSDLTCSGELIKAGTRINHNGILYNDHALRRQHALPKTKIETDSYVAVQLMEQKKALDTESLCKLDKVSLSCKQGI